MLHYALAYARLGWPVFPCHSADAAGCSCGNSGCASPGKHPLTSSGFHDATTDEATIRAWWTQWPGANIATATGKGRVVLDFDDMSQVDTWPHELVALLQANTPIARTGRPGGEARHVFLRCSVEVRSRGQVWPGVDVRGDGGYVILPPSRHESGNLYEWIQDPSYELAELPDTLDQFLASPRKDHDDDDDGPGWLRLSQDQEAEIRSALSCLSSEPRDIWLRMGMALKSTGAGEQAFRIWDEWSQTCPEKYTQEACRQAWGSVTETLRDGSEMTIRSLFHAAYLAGWRVDKPAPTTTPAGKAGQGIALRVDDLFTMPGKEPDWLIEDVMAVGESAILFGPSGSYKTFVALDLCARIVYGLRIWGCDVRKGHVLYLPGEGRLGLKKRLAAWAQGQPALPETHANFHVAETLPELSTEEGFLRVFATLQGARDAGEPYSLVVVDTLSWALGGGLDENSAKDVNILQVRVKRLREEFGVATLLVHHAGKAAQAVGMGGARGSSAITANAETVLQVVKKGNVCTVHVTKTKEGEAGRSIEREFVAVQLGVRDNGKPITSGYLREPGQKLDHVDLDLAFLMRHLLELEEGDGWSTRDLEGDCRPPQIPRARLRALIDYAVSVGYLVIETGDRGIRLHRISPGYRAQSSVPAQRAKNGQCAASVPPTVPPAHCPDGTLTVPEVGFDGNNDN